MTNTYPARVVADIDRTRGTKEPIRILYRENADPKTVM